MTVEALDHVMLWTMDMDRAVGFYGDLLGLKLINRYGNEWAEFDAGPVKIGLHGGGDRSSVPPGGTVVLRVGDLDSAKVGLRSGGVVFEDHDGEVEGLARFAMFADPDGNALQIIEYFEKGS